MNICDGFLNQAHLVITHDGQRLIFKPAEGYKLLHKAHYYLRTEKYIYYGCVFLSPYSISIFSANFSEYDYCKKDLL